VALRNLHAIANRYIAGAVSPNFLGNWLSSQGYAQIGDAAFTGAIAGTTLTVSAVASGALAVGSLLTDQTSALESATVIEALGSGTGGVGTYVVAPAQTVGSEPMAANGPGKRQQTYRTFADRPMQVQALSAEDFGLVDRLNIAETVRGVWMNGQVQGVQRPDIRGGDILQIPTGLSGNAYDTWLVKAVLEGWDADGWCHVAVVLQMPTQSQ